MKFAQVMRSISTECDKMPNKQSSSPTKQLVGWDSEKMPRPLFQPLEPNKMIKGNISSKTIIIGAMSMTPILLLLASYLWFIYSSPLNMSEMDLNNNGWVSFSEADYSASYGIREIQVNNESCIEYFAYKDGLPLKVTCNEKS